jgi:hypothetical protein
MGRFSVKCYHLTPATFKKDSTPWPSVLVLKCTIVFHPEIDACMHNIFLKEGQTSWFLQKNAENHLAKCNTNSPSKLSQPNKRVSTKTLLLASY